MGNAASEELEKFVSVSDLAMLTRKMRVIPSLPAECQIEAIRYLWRNMRWVSPREVLVQPGTPNDRMVVIVKGEAEAILGGYNCSYIPLLPAGSFVGEAAMVGVVSTGNSTGNSTGKRGPFWVLRRKPASQGTSNGTRTLPDPLMDLVESFLGGRTRGPTFHGKVCTTRRSLIAEITRAELRAAVARHNGAEAERLDNMLVSRNSLQNVASFAASRRELGAQDLAALRVVCEGPMRVSCSGATRGIRATLLGGCMSSTNGFRSSDQGGDTARTSVSLTA